MKRIIQEAFADGDTLQETLGLYGGDASVDYLITRYWQLLEMEEAFDQGRVYYDRVMESTHEE